MKVILVDDEIKFITMLAKRMTIRGIDVSVATNYKQALKLVTDERFDVAVLDIKMPGMGGLELKKEMALLNNEIKFIFVTGHGGADINEHNADSDNIYLSKPLDIEILINTIERLLHAK
jgi:DNA-binding NtrC family response regulator